MTAYIATAAGAVFLTVIAGMLMPEGKLGKTINFVLRIVCIAILISPVFKIFELDLESGGGGAVDYEYVCEVLSHSQSRALENLIEENMGVDCRCLVEVVYEDGAITQTSVTVCTDNVEKEVNDGIVSYLRELGYININVHEKTD